MTQVNSIRHISKADYLHIQTVEGMDYRFEVAGLGARSHAFIIDWHIRVLLALTWIMVVAFGVFSNQSITDLFDGHAFSKAQMLIMIPAGAIYFLYHVVLETVMSGRTPGKRMAGVRLVTLQGRSPSVGAVLLRNIFRLVDMLPGLYIVGLISVAVSKYQVRIGDIAAGLVLVYDNQIKSKAVQQVTELASHSHLSPADQEILLELLGRWRELNRETRLRLADLFLTRVGQPLTGSANAKERELAAKNALENCLKTTNASELSQKSEASHALSQWLSTRQSDWQSFEQKLTPHGLSQDAVIAESREMLASYRAVLSDLSLSRRANGESLITRYLESLSLKAQENIYRPASSVVSRLFDLYNQDVPLLMRRLKNALLSAFACFTLSAAVGWLLIHVFPDLVSLFASTTMVNNVQSGKLWTDDILNVAPSSLVSFRIATNNITVSLFAFALGAFYGLGTVYILGLNGLMLGGIFAFTASYNLHERLFAFVIGHGVVELSVIIISGAMGFELGEALIRPGNRYRTQAFQNACTDAGKVLLAATPFLVFAGLIEGFVSPNAIYGLAQRTLIGLSSGIIFWVIMLSGLPWVNKRNRIGRAAISG